MSRLLALIVIVGCLGELHAEQGIDPRRLLTEYLAGQSWLERFSMEGQTDIHVVKDLYGWAGTHRQVAFLLRRDGKSVDVSGRDLAVRDKQDRKQDHARQFRRVLSADYLALYEFDFNKVKIPRDGIASRKAAVADWQESFGRFFALHVYGMALDGFIGPPVEERLGARLLQANDLSCKGQEEVQGVQCTVLTGSTPFGRVTLWHAPAKGNVPVKMRLERGPNDLLTKDRTLAQYSHTVEGRTFSGTKRTTVLENVKTDRIGQSSVPVFGEMTDTWLLTGGQAIINKFVYQRKNITLNPSFAGTDAFHMDWRDGTPVTNEDDRESGVAYEWRGGKLVARSPALTGAKGAWGVRSILATIAWVLLGVVLVAAAAWFLLRKSPQPR